MQQFQSILFLHLRWWKFYCKDGWEDSRTGELRGWKAWWVVRTGKHIDNIPHVAIFWFSLVYKQQFWMDFFANISMNQRCLHVFVPADNRKNRGKNWWTTTIMTRRETARRHGHICFAFFCHITRDWYISSEHLRTLDLRLRSDDQCRKKSNSDGPRLRSDHCRSGFPKSFCFSNGQPIITNPLTWGFHRCARSRRAHCNWDAFTWHCPACEFFKIKHFQCIQCKGFPNNGFRWGPLTSSFKNGRNFNIFWDSHPTNCEISNWQWLINFSWTPERKTRWLRYTQEVLVLRDFSFEIDYF